MQAELHHQAVDAGLLEHDAIERSHQLERHAGRAAGVGRRRKPFVAGGEDAQPVAQQLLVEQWPAGDLVAAAHDATVVGAFCGRERACELLARPGEAPFQVLAFEPLQQSP
jgi:hypothetical protein